MRLIAKLRVTLNFSFEVRQNIQVVQSDELLTDSLHHFEVAFSVCCHKQSINYGAQSYSLFLLSQITMEEPNLNHIHNPNISKAVLYYTSFYLFNTYESELLYNFKFFIENAIMKLGEDWRIEANLLSQEIIAIRSAEDPSKDHSNFNLFNEFLSAYLKQKIGKEHEYTNYPESEIQKKFLQTVNLQFHQEKIHNGLTFKTLSLGYCITATEVWNKTFRNPIDKGIKNTMSLKPFAILSQINQTIPTESRNDSRSFEASSVRQKLENIDIMSSHLSYSEIDGYDKDDLEEKNQFRWQKLQTQLLNEKQIKQIKITIQKIPHNLKNTQVLSYFVSFVDELHLKSGTIVRVFSISNEFYLNAFIIWLIFNIKMFFSLNFEDYLRYFKELVGDNWKPEFERPLRKFQLILEREWNKLLKDFTVALHDDQEVLNILVDRVKKCIQGEWEVKITSLKESFQLGH